MRVRCKQRITTIGLDIYFQKVKPGKGINRDNVIELDHYNNELVKTKFKKKTEKIIADIENAVDIPTRTDLISKLRNYVKKVKEYEWYYKDLTPELTNKELKEHIEKLIDSVYAPNDVYFRKANFVYAFFAPYLENESCIVTKDMVRELIAKCDTVIEAAKKEGFINNKNKIPNLKDYYYQYKAGENMLNITPERQQEEDERINRLTEKLNNGHWIEIAQDVLPTQSGFFFGSTDYDIYYLSDVLNCKNKFEKLLKNWKDDEVVYNIMSW